MTAQQITMVLPHLRQVNRLTSVKERTAAEGILVEAMAALFQPSSVTLFEVAGPSGDVRCLERLDWNAHDRSLKATGAWSAWDHAMQLDQIDGAQACLQSGGPLWRQTARGSELLLPVANENGEQRLIRLGFEREAADQTTEVVEALVGVYRNFLELLDYSERDTLTGLLNRKSFDETFMKAARDVPREPTEDELVDSGQRLAASGGASFWLGVVDVDHFKRVNDTYGHLIGDEVLLLLAGVMRRTFRHADRLYRFGGEEFVVLLRAGDCELAHMAFERFRSAIENHPFPQVGRVTVSIGYTRLTPNDTPAAAFERADKVVYLAKSQGRNQVQCYEQAVAGGLITEINVGSALEEF